MQNKEEISVEDEKQYIFDLVSNMFCKYVKEDLVKEDQGNHILVKTIKKFILDFIKKFYRGIVFEIKGNKEYVFGKYIVIFSKKENLNSSVFCYVIEISEAWAKKLMENDFNYKVAFTQTIGHEMGHENEMISASFFKALNWVREINCDFYGLKVAMETYGLTKQEVIECCKLKIKEMKSCKKYDDSDITHPSWAYRLELMEKYDFFNEEVFDEIMRKANQKQNFYIRKKRSQINNVYLNS